MKVNVEATLFVPATQLYAGGSNGPVFQKHFKFEITPGKVMDRLLGYHEIEVDQTRLGIGTYEAGTNTLTATGYMRFASASYIALLEKSGWAGITEGQRKYPRIFKRVQ